MLECGCDNGNAESPPPTGKVEFKRPTAMLCNKVASQDFQTLMMARQYIKVLNCIGMELKSSKTASVKPPSDIVSLKAELKGRLEWSESDLLRSVLVLADSQSWQCITRIEDDDDDAKLVKFMKLYML